MIQKHKLLLVAGVMLLLGVILMVVPTPGEPALECVSGDGPTSGFTDESQGNCPVSIESFNAYSEWSSRPKWDNIAGLVLVLGGVGVGVTALVRGRRSRTTPDPGSAP